MKFDRYAYTDNFEHLRLQLSTEFQLDLNYTRKTAGTAENPARQQTA